MNLRVAVSGEVKGEDARSRSESESEQGVFSHWRQTRNRVIYTCPG